MDQYFERLTLIMKQVDLPARIRFMLQDILELRRNNVRENAPLHIPDVH